MKAGGSAQITSTCNGCINVTLMCFRLSIFAVEKSGSNTYSECVSVALIIQHAMRMRRYYAVICGLSGSTIFFSHYPFNGMISGKKKKNFNEHKNACFDFLYEFRLKYFSF